MARFTPQKNKFLLVIVLLFLIGISTYFYRQNSAITNTPNLTDNSNIDNEGGIIEDLVKEFHPLSIESMRQKQYPGSDIVIEQALDSGSNYDRYIVSYRSSGLKIYALLTVPQGTKPASGWPVVIFNHGFIPPDQYSTTERYIAYTDAFSRNGYIVFRSDYRGHGNSEGEATGGYGSNAYTEDVLNAVSSIKKLKIPSARSLQQSSGQAGQLADPARIGMWGHSMGGHITLRNMVANRDVKAGVIWAGVVASYPDLISRWRRNPPRPTLPGSRGSWRQSLILQYGEPDKNPEFWNSISANSYLKDISGPVQLHHGTADGSVPVEFSERLADQLKSAGKEVELHTYPGDDHNISQNFNIAIASSVEFFDKYLK